MSISNRVLLLLAIVVIAGEIALYSSNESFRNWFIEEDGLVEWLTVGCFIVALILATLRFLNSVRERLWSAVVFNLLVMTLCVFVVAEELSWFQRILNIQPGIFFQQNNLQGETNIHNLKVGEYKLNQWVFTIVLENALALYFFVFPLLCSASRSVDLWVRKVTIPVPGAIHGASFAVMYVLVSTNPDGKAWELMELTYGVLICLLLSTHLRRRETVA